MRFIPRPFAPGDNAAGAWVCHTGRSRVVDLGQDGVDGGGGEPAGSPGTIHDHLRQRIKTFESVG